MSGPTVRERPTAFNTHRLNGEISPGTSVLTAETVDEIQDQRQMLTTGANTVVQYTKNTVMQYAYTLWEIGHLQAFDRWLAMFLQGRAQRPPRVYQIVDLRATWVKQVVFESASAQDVDKPGGPWKRTVKLHEYKKIAPAGGPIKPGVLDQKLIDVQNQINAERGLPPLGQQVKSIPSGKPGR